MFAGADVCSIQDSLLACLWHENPNRLVNQVVASVITAYGDESSDESHRRVFAVAVLIGDDKQWKHAADQWVQRTGGRVFHAAECESDSGEFSKTDHKSNLKLYADLAAVIANSGLLGFGVAIDLAAYRLVFPRNLEDQPFFMCFGDVVRECAECGYLSIPREKVEFIFDRNFDIEYNATYLYDYMTKFPEWQAAQCLYEKLSFATRKTVGIQMVDLFAREVMKHLDNQVGPVLRPTRMSMRRLSDTRRFRCQFYNREGLEHLKAQASDLSKSGSKLSEYLAWIKVMKLQDDTSNRLRYLKRLTEKSEQ